MKHFSFTYFFLFFIFLDVISYAQDIAPRKAIQFSGVVVDGDSLFPVPFTNIIIRNTNRGTVADYYGFYSIVAQANDTIDFSAIGYKRASFVIPDTLHESRYSMIQLLFIDTVLLREAIVYPWPTREQFRDAFLSLRIPDDDKDRALRNLARSEMKELADALPMDGGMNYKWQMQQQQSRLYFIGQYPPNNLLNPVAWSQFIKAWQEGQFRRRD
jgi:hypothetical protein